MHIALHIGGKVCPARKRGRGVGPSPANGQAAGYRAPSTRIPSTCSGPQDCADNTKNHTLVSALHMKRGRRGCHIQPFKNGPSEGKRKRPHLNNSSQPNTPCQNTSLTPFPAQTSSSRSDFRTPTSNSLHVRGHPPPRSSSLLPMSRSSPAAGHDPQQSPGSSALAQTWKIIGGPDGAACSPKRIWIWCLVVHTFDRCRCRIGHRQDGEDGDPMG